MDRLLLLIRRAQGEAEAAALGAEDVLVECGLELAGAVHVRADELTELARTSV